MKNLYWLVFVLLLTTEICSQVLHSVSFTDANTGTAVGDGGTILRTTDGGNKWIKQSSGTTLDLMGVSFTDANTGIAVGYGWNNSCESIILSTIDGGDNWENQSVGSIELYDVCYTDANTGTAVGYDFFGNQSVILRTTDGGNHWSNQSSLKTNIIRDISFTDAYTGTAVGKIWSEGVHGGGIILKTIDGGKNWSCQLKDTTFDYCGFIGICFTDVYTGTAVGYGMNGSYNEGIIFRTTNGGNEWFSQSSGTTNILRGVSFTDANNGTAVGDGGTILTTTNGGNNWESQSVGTINLYDVCFTDENTGTAVGYDWNGDKSVILRTIDGGKSWINQTAENNGSVTVSGNVKYSNNEPAQFIYIQLYGVDSAKTYFTYTDVSGNYSVQVDKDFYYIYAKISYNAGCVMTYRVKYYDNKYSLSEADLVEVNNNISDIDFNFPVLIKGTISGTVKDAVTQQPLSNTVIEFYTAEVLADSNVVYTDQNGNYTIGVFEGNYILNTFRFFGYYYRQYYKEAYNPFDATPITVSQDNLNVTGIDFYLTSPEPGSNIIRGYVRDEAFYSLSNVEVYAIPLFEGNWIAAKTNFFGEYILRDIKNGEYILLFYKEGFISQYYNNVYQWEDAFVFNLTGSQNITTSDVYLDSLDSFGGEILGNVSTNSGSCLSATLLSAVNSSGKVVSSILSCYNGNYIIPFLENGTYKIKASKIGYASCEYSEEVQIDLINNPVANGINITINLTDIEKDKNKIPEFFELIQNYPNPFNPSTKISYSIPERSNVSLKVFDLLGSEVAELIDNSMETGNYNIEFDVSNLPSGVYFYQLKAGDFIDTKKMLLLK